MPADIAKVKELQIAETVGMEHYKDGHHLTVGHTARMVTVPLVKFSHGDTYVLGASLQDGGEKEDEQALHNINLGSFFICKSQVVTQKLREKDSPNESSEDTGFRLVISA